MNKTVLLLGAALAVGTALAQPGGYTRRATITGGGGDRGKCTIEVDVDDVAEVEVFGDTARLRTLTGIPAQWRRFECNGPMPANPVDFRFRGIDGRGNVQLVRDPRGGGPAVVRIEDRQGGRQGYTFDLEWTGGYGSQYPNQGVGSQRPYGYPNGGYPNGGYPNGGYPNGGYPNGNYPNRGGTYAANDAINYCQDAVRARLQRDFGVRDASFVRGGVEDNPGGRDYIGGLVESRRGDRFRYACSVNLNNGRVRSVDLNRVDSNYNRRRY